ncbi:MAG: TIGR01777 family oxidoreductase [Thermoleophilaceae bacterium]
MRVAITGATGTIGRALVRELGGRGDEVTALSRDASRANLGVETLDWRDPKAAPPPPDALRGRDAVVNLLGETVAQRWSDEAKREIRDSRVLSTRNLVAALAELPEGERPRVLVSQSASGWYGPRGDKRLDEDEPAGSDWLAGVVRDWEAEARGAAGLRVVLTRTGVVLSSGAGALAKMLPFFKLGIGGPVAGGEQYVPWVHIDDVVGVMAWCLAEQCSGAVNLTAPEPVTNKEFSRTLGRVLRRPALAPVPGLAVKILYGEMATIVTTGQRAVPARLTEMGYRFRRPDLEDALRSATA